LNLSPKHLIKILGVNGFSFKRTKYSRQICHNPTTNKAVIVPLHGNKDMPKGTFFAILRQADIDRNSI